MSSSNVRYAPEARARAKTDEKALFTIDVDGRMFPKESQVFRGRITIQGPMSELQSQRLMNFITEFKNAGAM